MDQELVYVGKILSLSPIQGADFIVSATAVCGAGGKWMGVVRKNQFKLGDPCLVYLPDSVVPESEEMAFMKSTGWRVKMRNFKGAPSEVVIMPYTGLSAIGTDYTQAAGVKRFLKPIAASLAADAKGDFPWFLRKTDEPNWQKVPQSVELLQGKGYYITEKADGSSTTAYMRAGQFGLCSRNLELKESANNGYWQVANHYGLKENLPDGYAIQWETCGPKIQKNPMGFTEIVGRAFSVWSIDNQEYLDYKDFVDFCDDLCFPTVRILEVGSSFECADLNEKAKGFYENGHKREGIVIRSQRHINAHVVSFKAINLEYDE